MRKVLFLALGLFLFFGTAGAVDKKGKIGAGFFNDDAPLGARYWLTDRFGFDLGFGINLRSVVDSTRDTNLDPLKALEPSKKTLTDFRFDAGLPVNLMRTEKINFLLRPGFSFQRISFFNQIFQTLIDTTQVLSDTSLIPGQPPDSIKYRYDSVFTPIGTVLDTVIEDLARSIDINLTVGVEYFPTEHFSISLFTGIGARSEQKTRYRRDRDGTPLLVADASGNRRPVEAEGRETYWTVTHRPFLRGVNVGFRYYF